MACGPAAFGGSRSNGANVGRRMRRHGQHIGIIACIPTAPERCRRLPTLTERTLQQALRKFTLSAVLPSNPQISMQRSSMTASHAASQRSRAVFPGRKAHFAKGALCAFLPSELTATKVRNSTLVPKCGWCSTDLRCGLDTIVGCG